MSKEKGGGEEEYDQDEEDRKVVAWSLLTWLEQLLEKPENQEFIKEIREKNK